MANYEGITLVPVFVRRLSGDLKFFSQSEKENAITFRKIEPKPVVEDASAGGDQQPDVKKKRKKKESTIRFLGSNPTRRGVRLCIICKGRIGYRSKKCKHCLKTPAVTKNNLETAEEQLNETVLLSGSTEDKRQEKENICQPRDENTIVSSPTLNQFQTEMPQIQRKESNDNREMLYNHGDDDAFCNDTTLTGEKVASKQLTDPEQQTNIAFEKHNIDEESRQKSINDLTQGSSLAQQPCSNSDEFPSLGQRKTVIPEITENYSKYNVELPNHDVELFCNDTTYTEEKPIENKDLMADDVGGQQIKFHEEVELLCNDTTYTEGNRIENKELIGTDVEEQQINLPSEKLGSIPGEFSQEASNVSDVQNANNVSDVQNVPLDQQSCSDSHEHFMAVPDVVENQEISTSVCTISSGELQEVMNGENLTPTGSKRKQKVYSGRKKKQKMVCSVYQFVRIEPKPCLDKSAKSPLKLTFQRNSVKNAGKIDPKRLLTSNATRRGIMPCPLCQKEVGCRSKTCKHCKVAIHFTESKALEHTNLLIVQLSPLTDPECVVFSVKKTTTPSEERCFLKQTTTKEKSKDCKKVDSASNDFNWSCECIMSNEKESGLCEHAMFFFRSPKIVQARTAMLTGQTIDRLPIDGSFKQKLKELWEKNQTRELPLVQQVALNTLVVLETKENVSSEEDCDDSSCTTENRSCVHIRFEKVKRQSFVQPHIFCSGKSCSFWSPFEVQKDSPVTCLHYCISLWAIASDNQLEGYFKIFLEAPQVYLHSEVFESTVSP